MTNLKQGRPRHSHFNPCKFLTLFMLLGHGGRMVVSRVSSYLNGPGFNSRRSQKFLGRKISQRSKYVPASIVDSTKKLIICQPRVCYQVSIQNYKEVFLPLASHTTHLYLCFASQMVLLGFIEISFRSEKSISMASP